MRVVVNPPELHPVVEAPWFDGTPPWPWPIADRKPFSFIRLARAMEHVDVGSVIAQIVTDLDAAPTIPALAASVLEAESLQLPGGLQASQEGREINPSCCCGLEGWREWLWCLESGESPWMGHEPTPWVEWQGGVARVWSDGGMVGLPGDHAFAIQFDRECLASELDRVSRELVEFLSLVEAWAVTTGWPDPRALCRKLDSCFGITKAAE